MHEQQAWLYSRTPRIEQTYIDIAKQVIKDKLKGKYDTDQQWNEPTT